MTEERAGNGPYRAGDEAVKTWFLFSSLWFPLFAGFGFILAVKFFFPAFLGDYRWLTFGVLRPAHVNGVLFGFVTSGLLGAMFWIIPRLCDVPLSRPSLVRALAVLWNLAVVIGIVLILTGNTQGREYAEFPWIIDAAVMIALLLMGYVIFETLVRRKERKLYVTLWYYAGTFIWFPVVYFIGNVMWRIPEGALNGVRDGIFNWYYGHNVLGLWFTTLGIPAWYYFVPTIIRRPLYSHLLSLIAFFSIAFFYTGVGAHHLLQAPIPEWLKTVGVLMSILMLVPVLAFATNIFLTMRGAWNRVINHVPFQFIMAGFLLYILVSLQGSFQSTRISNAFLHFSQWPVGHAHLALLGGFGFLAAGMIYLLVPRITGTRIFSRFLMKLSFWLAFLGFATFFLAMTVAGLVANSNWWQHINVVETLPTLRIHFIVRAIGGGTVVLGAVVFAVNILTTLWLSRHPHEEATAERLTDVQSTRKHSPFLRYSQEKLNLPIIATGGTAVFALMTFMVIAMPYMFAPNAPSGRAHAYAGAEQRGMELYKEMGCFYCHSQFVRPQDWGRGETSRPGDFFYSIPHFLGTERTGPNLAQIGGKRPSVWHEEHHRDPRKLSPRSVMPPFAFLADRELDALAQYVQNLGGYDLTPQAFQPLVPPAFRDKKNPHAPLLADVSKAYNAKDQTYSGDAGQGKAWAAVFEEGKKRYSRKCLSCHGCSANGQGPYARNTLARPANLNERLRNYPNPDAPFHFWRVSEGVPGTAMPPWGWTESEETLWKINTYEMSFTGGAVRTVSGDISDEEGDRFAKDTNITPPIEGTKAEFEKGEKVYRMYCAQCHGLDGKGDGPASVASPGGYIRPEPANFEESGKDFTLYGRYVWKVREGVETTNMPPWKEVLPDEDIFPAIFYIQGFSASEDYRTKWAPLYKDRFARDLRK
ncbi:MAG TPA: cbb3-type cytochrome c oxidase subunit I [Syntrophales bacterium]|nr:cbb3-type cytochrome c oxidase subunit I [Syntrophales bacterium]HQN78658.1 cbb3-type cytochrome c oxidase subunit I [Syntrophales bacterium]HQQ28356.1 cbb3-type cytochrome c oxidase subunit I [Syntrophales bacterium]